MNTAAIFWIVWFAFTVAITWTGLVWEIDYFHSPGPQFRPVLLALLAAAPLIVAAYHRLRRFWFRWEPLIAALPLIAGLVYAPRATLVAAVIVVATVAAGRQICAFLRLDPEGPIERIVLAAALGFGLCNCVLFVFGLARLYTAAALAVWFALMLVFGARRLPSLWVDLKECARGWGTLADSRSLLGSVLVLFGIALIAVTSMVILAPSLAFDVNAIHLPLAHYYASQHALRVPPYLSYGYFPQSVEVLMTAGYIFGGDPAAQMLPPVFFALALLTAYRIGRLCGLDRFTSFAGLVLAVAAPFVHWDGSVAKNDFALVFFVLAALLGYLRWRETQDFRWIVAGTFFLAAAAGVKHIVIFSLAPLALLFLQAVLRRRKPLRSAALLVLVFSCFGLFWHLRTWLATGNPVYPQSASVAAHAVIGYRGSLFANVVLPYLELPWKMFFHGHSYFESVLAQPLGIALVMFLPFWLLLRRAVTAAEKAVLLFCGLYLAYWAVTLQMIRFAIAPYLLLMLLTVGRAIPFWRKASIPIRSSLVTAAAYVMLFGLLGIAIIEVNAPQLRYFAFRIDRTGYLREALTPYRALEFVRYASHPGDAVFAIEACSTVYAPDPNTFDCALTAKGPPQELLALIHAKNYRFLVMPRNHPELVPPGWTEAYSDRLYEVFTR